MYEINYDLRYIGYNHIHRDGKLVREYRYYRRLAATFIVSIILGLLYRHGIFIAYGIMTFLNFVDGFKPWYYKFEYHQEQSTLRNLIRRMFYGRKMSLQYLLIWDVVGVLIGGLIIWIVKLI